MRAPEAFVRETFKPEFDEMHVAVHEHLREILERVVRAEIHADPPTLDVLAQDAPPVGRT